MGEPANLGYAEAISVETFDKHGSQPSQAQPGLIFTPKQASGVGLASVEIACKTQLVKHTMQ
jgi:hypothetical protein